MTFTGAIESVLRQYATFTGRATRAEYWWFYLFTILVGIVASVVDLAVGNEFVSRAVNIVLIVPSIAVGVRRLHDSGLSGWWILAPIGGVAAAVAAVVAGLVVGFSGVGLAATGAALALFGLGVVLLIGGAVTGIVLMVRPGNDGTNRFGPDPRAPYTAVDYSVDYAAGYAVGYGVGHGYQVPTPTTTPCVIPTGTVSHTVNDTDTVTGAPADADHRDVAAQEAEDATPVRDTTDSDDTPADPSQA